MNILHAGFATAVVAAGVLASAPTAVSFAPAVSAYKWAQPGTTLVTTPHAQPPAWLGIGTQPTRPALATSSYRWAQPWSAPVSTPHAQPPVLTITR